MNKSKMVKGFFITLGLLFLVLILFSTNFVKKNTSLLNFSPDKEFIEQNNLNKPLESAEDEMVTQNIRVNGVNRALSLPKQFKIEVFVDGFAASRSLVFDDNGNMFVTDKGAGDLVMVTPNGSKTIVDSNLKNIHGVEFYAGDLYIAEEHQVVVYKQINSAGNFSEKSVLISKLPSGKGHVTRTVKVNPLDEKIYLSVGSSCNVCEEDDKRRAAIVRYNLDGSGEEVWAEGLRNTVGFTFDQQGNLYGVDNGRDLIGDELPPEEVNLILGGKHYGWPYCYGDRVPNPEFLDRLDFCEKQTEAPFLQMQAHSAPLGITIDEWQESNSNQFIIAYHGSWNRTTPTGYKIVRTSTRESNPVVSNFIVGWLQNDGKSWGRPVDVVFNKDALYITDDKAGVIYKVSKI